MVIFKLILLLLLLLIFYGLFRLGKYLFKVADQMDVEEKKSDIEHKAELASDVDEYVEKNSEVIDKSKSDTVNEFLEN